MVNIDQVARATIDVEATTLECRGLRKRFGEIVAVDDVGFRVEQGETYGLLGPNGAGKTTAVFPDTVRDVAHVTPHARANYAAVPLALATWRLRRAITA